MVNGIQDTILTRHAGETGNELAAEYIKQELERYGVETFEQHYIPANGGKNIYGIQWGELHPDKYYIICAHFDDQPSGPIAPGADDNASGTAAVLEAARLLSGYITRHSIIYALWDEEELGLIGSCYFADSAKSNQLDILGVINLDMISYDSNNDRVAEIHINNSPGSIFLSERMMEVNEDYRIGLTLQVINPGTPASDHSSFWDNGYGALLLIEDLRASQFMENDFNPYYHTSDDRLISLDLVYYEQCAKAAIGTLVKLDGIGSITEVAAAAAVPVNIGLSQNYPNPFNPSTVIQYSLAAGSHVKLQVIDVLGNQLVVLVDEYKSAGTYTVKFNTKEKLTSGVYFYKLTSGGQMITRKMIIAK